MNATHKNTALALTVAAALTIGLGYAFWNGGASRPADAPRATSAVAPTFAWTTGDRQSYDFVVDSNVHVSLDAKDGTIAQNLTGVLNLRVLDVDPTGVDVGMQLAPLRVTVGGRSEPRIDQRLSTPFTVRFEPDGRIAAFEFAQTLEQRERMQLAEVLRTFQVVIPPNAVGRWTTREQQAAGAYRAEYTVAESGDVHKRKIAFDVSDAQRTEVVRSTAGAGLTGGTSWLTSFESDEELRVSLDGDQIGASRTRAQLTLRPTRADAALFDDEATFTAGLQRLDPQARALTPEHRVPTRAATAADRERFRALADRLTTSDGDDIKALREMALALAAMPELAGLVPDLVAQGTSDGTISALIHALERAENAACQAALVTVTADDRVTVGNRVRAIMGLGSVSAATDATIARLWDVHASRSDDAQRELSDTALLSLGRVGHALRESGAPAYPAIRERLVAATRNGDARHTGIALKALGNAADSAIVPDVAPHLHSGDAYVRDSAARALGSVATPAAIDRLATRLGVEDDGRVRSSIVTGLAKQPTPHTLSTVDGMIADERDDVARYAMARYLGDNIETFPHGRETLRRVLATESDQRIRTYVAGRLAATR